jgi:hypothetical protein
MSHSDMKHYRNQLRHIVRPEDPAERGTNSVAVNDYAALFLYRKLVEYASYEAETAEEEEIALGYAEYINDVIRNEGKNVVRLYAHTSAARDVLCAAAPDEHSKEFPGMRQTFREKFGAMD